MSETRQTLIRLLAHPQSAALVNALDELYPERTPRPGTDPRQIDVEIGKREVVRLLRSLQEEARENTLGA